MYIINE